MCRRIFRRVFLALAVLISDVGCAVVAYQYSALVQCSRFGYCSAPPSVALWYAVPFALGIGLCILAAGLLGRSSRKGASCPEPEAPPRNP